MPLSVWQLWRHPRTHDFALRADCVSEDTDAGMIQAWLDAHRDRRVCVMMLHKEALGNFSRPTRAESDHICEIMSSVVQGWARGPLTRFELYGAQNSWIYKDQSCKLAQDEAFQAEQAHTVTEAEAGQMEIPF